MIALVTFMTPGQAATSVDRRALIEAIEEGWWYSAWLPDGGLVLAFQTDPGPGRRGRWSEYLRMAPETAGRAAGAACGDVRVVSANSHRTEPVAGEAWLAVGDAATAHDPLSGLGIHWALESGIRGAEAILAGGPSATEAYSRDRHESFDRYLVTRTQYYRVEKRWPDAPFWRRRQASQGAQPAEQAYRQR
jgi:flavin-dependent dehydrogenase